MNTLTDQQLLREYRETFSEQAFTELVRRHVDLVYSAALRMTCNAETAKDVTQGVFLALAQNAPKLADHPVLSGWLHRSTRNIASQAVRTEVRRQAREQEAAAMNEMLTTDAAPGWEHIAPHLDAALTELNDADRDALLLRFFERKSARESAQSLGISEEAMQKRVNRAVERLRGLFAKRGIAVGAGGLVVVISANAVQAAPAGLVSAIPTAAGTGVMAATTSTGSLCAKGLGAMKSAGMLGAAGSALAMLGGAFISLMAKIDDTKSSREREFVKKMLGLRIVVFMPLFTALGAYELPFFHKSIARAIFTAALLYFAAGAATILMFYQAQRQKKIQMEDGTYDEAEWTPSGKKIQAGPGDTSKTCARPQPIRFMAFSIVIAAIYITEFLMDHEWGWALVLLVTLAASLFRGYLILKKRPRYAYLSYHSNWYIMIPVVFGLMTLLAFNFHQIQVFFEPGPVVATSNAVVWAFNSAVILAYVGLGIILNQIRKKLSLRNSPTMAA